MTLHIAVCVALLTIPACRTADPASEVKDAGGAPTPVQPNQPPVFKVITQDSLEPDVEALGGDQIAVCSFNVSFVGHWKAKDKQSKALAALLEPCDVIAMQELVAPPTNLGIDANGQILTWLDQDKMLQVAATKDPTEQIDQFVPWWTETNKPVGLVEEWSADYQALNFVGHMKNAGFDYEISTGDTGKTVNHNNSTSSEWHIVFYRPSVVSPVPGTDMPGGWTILGPQEPLAKHPVFDRVPYAFSFRTTPRHDGKQLDFVLINVHLHSTQTRDNEKEQEAALVRANELFFVNKWIEKMKSQHAERDFITLGDMNVVSCTQLDEIKSELKRLMTAAKMTDFDDLTSLNRSCHRTNISKADPKPFDQVMFNRKHTTEILKSDAYGADLVTVDIGEKYGLTTTFGNVVGNFVKAYSDHQPLLFVMKVGMDDD